MALTAPSTADFTLSATVTNESIGTTCSQNESATVTK
jgi:hypothetical protein